jgi:hypothetical protein
MASSKTIKVEQTGSAQRRHHTQRETLIGSAEQDRPHQGIARQSGDARHDREGQAPRARG